MKVALVHDYLYEYSGGKKVLETLPKIAVREVLRKLLTGKK